MIRSKQSPQIERILSLFKSIRLTQLQCVNMVFPRSDNIETVPLLLNSCLSPHKTTDQKYVLVIKREQNQQIFVRRGMLSKQKPSYKTKSEFQIKCYQISADPIGAGRFVPQPQIRFSQFQYTLYCKTPSEKIEESYYPYLVATDKLITGYFLQFDSELKKPILQQFDLMDLVEQSNYENSDIEKQIVDVQFDSCRENALWVLLCHIKLSLYTLISMTLDTTKTKQEFYTHIANEEHVFSPSLFKQNQFQPLGFKQYFHKTLDQEVVFLHSGAKLAMYMRSSPPVKYKVKDSPVYFTPFFIVDYISLLGMKRKLFFLNEYCDIDDYKFLSRDKRKNDSLKDMQPEEFYYYLNGVMPLNRQCPIDMDDDIAVLPDIISRKINTLLVVPFQKLPLIAEISTNYGKKLTNIQQVFEGIGRITEEGPTLEESQITQVEICARGKSMRGEQQKFSSQYDKLILVSNLKSVSLWAVTSVQNILTVKLCNIVPFTQFSYLNKLQLVNCQFSTNEVNNDVEVYCFTTTNKVFKFSIIP